MRKKTVQPKSKTSHSSKSKRTDHPLIIAVQYVVGIVSVYFLVSWLQPFVLPQSGPCGNTISCKTPPKLEIDTNAVGIFHNQKVIAPNIALSSNDQQSNVLGAKNTDIGAKKHIYVDLTTQTLTAYEDDTLFMRTPISSGLWGKTPTGDFTIWTKFRATRMSGGSGADYYDLPNVPYVMFFSNSEVPGSAGFSIHGTYWHNNFGHAMSHGCVNMKTTDVAKLYEWADGPQDGKQGTLITISGEWPM